MGVYNIVLTFNESNITVKSVSYTHLDVYKRQQRWMCLTFKLAADAHNDAIEVLEMSNIFRPTRRFHLRCERARSSLVGRLAHDI